MEYERIHKVQTGIISPSKLSPSKLRMKLMGPHHNRKKGGSNSNSARTSPSRLEDTEFVKNSLLSSKNGDFDDEASSSQMASLNLQSQVILAPGQGDQTDNPPKEKFSRENGGLDHTKLQQFHKAENINLSAIHPMRTSEDENLDYDSNASSSSFEFHKERSAHNQFTRSFSRPMSSKWDDAEKWIVNRQIVQPNYSKKNPLYNQPNRMPMTNPVRVAPELTANAGSRITDTKRVDCCQPASQLAIEKFSFISSGTPSLPIQTYEGNASVNQCTQSKDMNEAEKIAKGSSEDKQVVPFVRSVCMRDMGTEMTPATSQEPSRTATPIGATTPLRSATSSMPSTPRRGAPASTPIEQGTDDDVQATNKIGKKGGLSEQELKEKTRREIVALGVQLGKMNIAAWASKDAQENNASSVETSDGMELQRIDFEKRAAVWEEAEKSKHAARYKREEIKIQAWESQQKAKLEAELRRIEARVEQMRAQAQSKMVKKIAMARQKSEEKRAAAEARKNRDAERTTAQAEHIRRTGRLPPSHYICCGWLS